MKKLIFNSATVAAGYILVGCSFILDSIDALADLAGLPDLKQAFSDFFGGDPKVIARYTFATSVIMLIARLRTIRRTNGDHQ